MAASYQQSSRCSTRAVQKSLTLNKKYSRVFWGKKENQPFVEKWWQKAKGLGRFQKGERVGEHSWWFVLLAAKTHPPTQKCLLTQASQSGSLVYLEISIGFIHIQELGKKTDMSVSTFNFCLNKIPYCWSWLVGDWMPNSRLVAWLPCWTAGYLREEKKKSHQVTDRVFISKCNFLFCSVTIFWEEKNSTGDNVC